MTDDPFETVVVQCLRRRCRVLGDGTISLNSVWCKIHRKSMEVKN